MVSVEVGMIKVTSMPNEVYEAAKNGNMLLDEYLRADGLRSCEFGFLTTAPGVWWEMSEEDYTMFLLRWT